MHPRRTYRAISLDLWSTVLIEPPDSLARIREAQLRFLEQHFRTRGGRRVDRAELERRMDAVHAELRGEGRDPIEVEPGARLDRYSAGLQRASSEERADLDRAFTRVGLEDPPRINPEARELMSALRARDVPFIAISDTGRGEECWQEYFRERGETGFRAIVTSCEVGRAKPHPALFREGARRLELPPSQILHVGDRWDRDAQGALAAGFGAAVYSGLWHVAPRDDPPPMDEAEIARAGVLRLHRLDDRHLLELLSA